MARRLPPGFRFHPTDVELVKYYLKRKVMGKRFPIEAIPEVDIYKFAPWDLPDKSCLRSGDLKWYFFCPREKKYTKGGRMNRATEFGFWKTTGKDRPVNHGGKKVGMIRSLIFHRRGPQVQRTDWVMHEYRLEDMDLTGVAQDAFVICMIFQKEGPGPRNGAQYGAPFNEEEWDNDEDVIDSSHGLLMGGPSAPAFLPPQNQSSIITVGPSAAENLYFGPTSKSDLSQVVQSGSNGISCISGNVLVGDCSVQGAVDTYKDGISCSHDLDSSAGIQNKIVTDLNLDEIFGDLSDLVEPSILNGFGSGYEITGQQEQNVGQLISSEILELNDLESPLGQFNSGDSTILSGLASGRDMTGQPEHCTVGQFNSSDFVELNDLESPLACPNEACQYEGPPNSNTISIFDCYDTSDSFSLAYSPSGDEQLAVGVPVNPTGQSFLNLSQRPYLDRNFGSGNFVDVFFEENGVNNCANNGYIGHQDNDNTLNYSGNNLGVERELSLESLRRGYQRIPYCRLQNLRDPAPVCGAKSYEGYALLPPIGGTSLHVKAEVTRGSGDTKDALSIKVEGSPNEESQNGSGLVMRVIFSRCMNTLCFYLVSMFLPIPLYIKTFNTENRIAMNIYYYMLEYLI